MTMTKKTTSRAAGDSPYYTFELKGGRGSIELPSVTHIIKSVMNNGMGGMAYWGAKLALGWALPDIDLDEVYDQFKKSDADPNHQRDTGGTRGTGAHDLLQQLVLEQVKLAYIEDDYVIYDGLTETKLESYERGVAAWFLDNGIGNMLMAVESEVPVWSLRHCFAGTADLVIDNQAVLDLKTHKPPARFEDALQIAAYSLALEEMRDTAVTRNQVILAKADGTYEVVDVDVAPAVFIRVREVYDHLDGWKL